MKKVASIKMLTPKQYADMHKVAYTTVMKWLQKGLIQGAKKEPLPLPFTGHIYQVPENANPPELKPGPKPGTKKKAESKKGKAK